MRLSKTLQLTNTFLLMAIVATGAQAQIMSGEAVASAEAIVYQESGNANGGGYHMLCVGNEGNLLRRGYVRYDLPDIPAGSTITRVVLNVEQYRIYQVADNRTGGVREPKAANLGVRRVTSPWLEGKGAGFPGFGKLHPDCSGSLQSLGDTVTWDNAPSNQDHLSARAAMPPEIDFLVTMDTDEGTVNDGLIDDVQSWVNGEGNHGWMLSVLEELQTDNSRLLKLGVLTIEWDESTAYSFVINPGLNEAWFNPDTDGQGLLIIVYESIPLLFLAWFTYETDAPPASAVTSLDRADNSFRELAASLGDDKHRWITASGPYEGNTALLDVVVTSGGRFDAGDPVEREVVGTIELTFEDCKKGVVKYNIPSIGKQGEVPIQRVANDNVPSCEAQSGEPNAPFALTSVTRTSTQAKSVEVTLAEETTIYEDNPDGNGGDYPTICVGNNGPASTTRRALARYELPKIPAGSTIDRVQFEIRQLRARTNGEGPKEANLELRRVTSAWEEGVGGQETAPCGGASDATGVDWNDAPGNRNEISASINLPATEFFTSVIDTAEGDDNDGLIDDIQAWVDGADNYGWSLRVAEENSADNARLVYLRTLTIDWTETGESEDFVINPGLNDAWYNPATDGQGIFIIVYPDVPLLFLAWFTYETGAPPDGALASLQRATDPHAALTAMLGDDDHRWLTAAGSYEGNRALLDLVITRGGVFDSSEPVERSFDGTIEVVFEDCMKGVVKYNIPSIDIQGEVPIQRVANDNVPICEAFNSQ